MARTLDATQTRDRESSLYVVNLVKVTTYTDRVAKTGAKAFYFGSHAVRYDYGNTGTDVDFWPVFLRANPRNEINHLPGPDDTFGREFEVELSNPVIHGERLIAHLRQYNTTGAEIEFAQITLDVPPVAGKVDLTAMTGDEHTVFQTGIISSIGTVTDDAITLECKTDTPSLANWWTYATGSSVDPKDVGRRYPMPFGRAKRIQCVGESVGWVTTMAAPMTDDYLGDVAVTDASGVPNGSLTFKIGNEIVTASRTGPAPGEAYTSDDTVPQFLNITARAQNGTKATRHNAGEIIFHLASSVVFKCAGYAVDDIPNIYIRNPVANDELVRVPAGFYTVDTANATITFTQTELQTVLGQMFSDVAFTPPDSVVNNLSIAFDNTTALSNANTPAIFTEGVSVTTWGRADLGGSPVQRTLQMYKDNSVSTDEVLEYSVKITGEGISYLANADDHQLLAYARNLPGFNPGEVLANFQYSNSNSGVLTAESRTVTPPGGTTVDDLVNLTGDQGGPWVEAIGGTGSTFPNLNFADVLVYPDQCSFEVVSITVPDLGDSEFFGATVGFGIDLYADVDGPVTPDTSYSSGSTGTLITRAADVIKWFVEEVGGETVDSASFTTSVTNLGINDLSGDFRALGETYDQILAQLAYNSRSNVFPEDTAAGSRTWKMLQANADYTWERPNEYIREYGEGVRDIARATSDLASHYTFRYAIDASRGDSEDAFRGVALATPSVSDVSITTTQLDNAQKRFGVIEADQKLFRAIRLAATAEEVAGYYVHEGIADDRRVMTIPQVPWTEAYRLQAGDIRWVVPPWNRVAADDRIFPLDAVGSWGGASASLSAVAAPGGTTQEGAAVIKVTQTSGSIWAIRHNDYAATAGGRLVDLRGRSISFRVYFEAGLHAILDTPGTAFAVRIGSATGGGTEFREWFIPKTNLPASATWGTLVIPINSTPDVEDGLIDLTKNTYWRLQVRCSTTGTGLAFYVDDMRIVDTPVALRITGIEKSTDTEHSDIVGVEVPAPITLAAIAQGSSPVTSAWRQPAMQIYGGYASGDDRGQRLYVRDGEYTNFDHYIQLSGGLDPLTAEALDVEFDTPPYPEEGERIIQVWANRVGGGAVQSIVISDTQGGAGELLGSIEASELLEHDDPPKYFAFVTRHPGNWVRFYGGGPASGDAAQIFLVEREISDVVFADLTITSQLPTSSAGTGADLANAIDNNSSTYATLDDGEYVQATFASDTYDAQLVWIDYVSEDDASVPDGMAAYLGDVRGGSPTAVLTADTELTDDVSTSNNVGTDSRAYIQLYSNVSDEDVYVYGEAGDSALQVYRIRRQLIVFPTRYTQLPQKVYNGATDEKERRTGVRVRSLYPTDASGWESYADGADTISYYDIEFDAPPSAITTTQTIKFDITGWSVDSADVEVLVGATQGAGSVEHSFITTPAEQSISFTTATVGDWVRVRAKTSADNFRHLRNVVRVLPDSLPATVEAQDGSSTGGVGVADSANAIDGDTTTFATLVTNAYLQVTMPTPSAYDKQVLVVEMQSAGTGADFSIFAGGIKGTGTSMTDDGPNDVARHEGSKRVRFEIYTDDNTSDDFYIYNEGADTLRVYDVSIKRLDW